MNTTSVKCPVCGAPEGSPCIYTTTWTAGGRPIELKGPQGSHWARVKAARTGGAS